MSDHFNEFDDSDFGLRDKHSFEFKFDYSPANLNKGNLYNQEFYLFIPQALQVNERTYSKKEFYNDLTSWIRFKTPNISLDKLNESEKVSPLFKINQLLNEKNADPIIEDELKLYGNIFRSQIRNHSKKFALLIRENKKPNHEINQEILDFLDLVLKTVNAFSIFRKKFKEVCENSTLVEYCEYVDEFISIILEYNLTAVLRDIRELKNPAFRESDALISNIVKVQYNYRQKEGYYSQAAKNSEEKNELFIYRKGLLKKFIMEALLLSTERDIPQELYQQLISSFAAGLAMLVYLLLFIWQGNVFVMNSTPFVVATVVLYILKDRLKESLKVVSSKRLFKIFPDYVTKIQTPHEHVKVGTLSESFCFLNHKNLPKEIWKIRNQKFHTEIEKVQRRESILFYRREVFLSPNLMKRGSRRCELNNIFRLHIVPFIKKASDPISHYFFLEEESGKLLHTPSPKVYHLNMIVKSCYKNKQGKSVSQIKQIRLIVDKKGIKRIERVAV